MYMLIPSTFLHMLIVGSLSFIYVMFMYFYNVPPQNGFECGKAVLTPDCNFGGYLDRLIFPVGFMIRPNDPEGLFSTLSSILNAYMGFLYSYFFKLYKSDKLKLLKYWVALTLILISLGYYGMAGMPFNKKIWSASFALVSAGYTGLGLVVCFLLLDFLFTDNRWVKIIIRPFVWLGMNPLFVFVGMIFVENILMNDVFIHFDKATNTGESVWQWITINWF